MAQVIPPSPPRRNRHTDHHAALDARVLRGLGLLVADEGIAIATNEQGQYVIRATNRPKSGPLGFRGEYSQEQSYSAGDTFIVSTNTTISGIAVIAGYYGVPPAGTDVSGSWYGFVPANPTGNAVPQYPNPAIGAAPNDKFYARLIIPYC